MANDTRFIDMLLQRISLSIHTSGPARVISFDEAKQTAEIELLFLSVDSDGTTEKYPILQEVPVQGMRYKIRESFPTEINGLIGVHGGVDGSSSTVKPKKEVEYYPYLKVDDVVWVAFAERALDNMNGTTPFDPEYTRMHDIRDAVITGILFFSP